MINNASRGLNDIATSAAKLDVVMDRVQKTADQLNTTLAAQNLASQAASAGLEKVARSAYGAAAAQSAYAASLRDSTGALAASGAATTLLYGRYLGLFRLFGARVPLFGGAATIGGIHLLIDVFAEFLAVVIPAAIALTAFGLLAGPIFVDMYNHLVNVQKVVTATGKSIYPFTSALTSLQNAVRPEAYLLFGDALVVAGAKTKALGLLAIGTGKVLDQLGNRAAAAMTSGGLDVFMKNAVQDVQRLGMVVGNVFGIIGNLLRAVPGYAQTLLNVLKGVTGFAETVTGSGVAQGIAKVGFAAHGAFIYIGLLGTAAGFLARVGLTGIAKVASGAVGGMVRLGLGSTRAAGAMASLGDAAAGAAALPWAWIGLAAAAVGFLVFKLVTAKDAAQQFVATLNTKLSAAPAAQGLQAIAQAIASVNAQMKAVGKETIVTGGVSSGKAYNAGSLVVSQITDPAYLAELVSLKTQSTQYSAVVARLGKEYGSVATAQVLLAQSGLTYGQITSKNASQEAQNAVALQSVYDVYKAMGAPGGALGADIAVMGRLNGVSSEQVTAIASLNSAWDSFLSAVTGSQSAFDTYGQGLKTLDTAQTTATDHLGKYSNAIKLAGAAMDGTTQADIALNQAFTTQVTQTGAMIDAWRTAGITGAMLKDGVVNAIAPMLKFGQGSKEATAQLIALASEAGYQGPETLKALTAWLGITHDSLQKVKNVTDQATIQEALLTSAMQGQGGVITGQLIGDLNMAILKYSGVYQAVQAYGKALATQGSQSQAAHTARQNLITDIVNAGHAAHETTGQIAAMIAKVLKIPLKLAMQIVVSAEGAWKVLDASTHVGSPFNISSAKPHAAGGYISTGRAGVDDQLIRVQKGELVVPAGMVASGAVSHLQGQIPGYAAGGVVGSYSGTPSGAGTFAQGEYGKTVTAVAASTAAATVAAIAAASSFGGSPYGASSGGANAALARRMYPPWGSGAEWAAWNYVGMRESGWNAYAQNPTSKAAGIAQNIAGWGPNYQPGNAGQQIAWMIRYIQQRYGDPIGAAAHERGFNWYGGGLTGGIFSSPTLIGVGDGGPERVDITPAGSGGGEMLSVLKDIRDGIDDLVDAMTGSPGGTSPGVALAGAGARLAGYKQMFNTRG